MQRPPAAALPDLEAAWRRLGRWGRRLGRRRWHSQRALLAEDHDKLDSDSGRGLDVEETAEALADGQHQLQELRLRPDVHVDRVAGVFELASPHLHPLLGSRLRGSHVRAFDLGHHIAAPLLVVLGAGALTTLLVVGDHVLDRRQRPPVVEGEALVGDGVEEDAAGTEFPQVGLDRPDRVLGVLEEVVGDDEVLALGGDRGQRLAVVDHVDVGQVPIDEFRGFASQVGRGQTVDIAGVRVGGQRHRLVQRSDLDPLAEQVAVGEGGAGVQIDRYRVELGRELSGHFDRAHCVQATSRFGNEGAPLSGLAPMRICLTAPAPTAVGAVAYSVPALADALAHRHEVTIVHVGAVPPTNGTGPQRVRELTAPIDGEVAGLAVSCEEQRQGAAVLAAIHAAYGEDGPDYLEVPDLGATGLVALQARQTGDPALAGTRIRVRIAPSAELLALHDGSQTPEEMTRIADLEREQLRLAIALLWPGGDLLDLYRGHYGARLPRAHRVPTLFLAAPVAAAPVPPPGGPLRILYVGDLRVRAGALDLAEACLWLPQDEWRLTMVGADSGTAALGQSVRLTVEAMSGDDPRIEILEPESGGAPFAAWGEHDLLVVPSLLGAWSTVAGTAMAAGLPVLATPVGVLPELVEDGDRGWLAAGTGPKHLRRALARLLADRGELQRLRRSPSPRARAAVLADPEPVLRAYDDLLAERRREEVLGGRAPLV